ncbi:MAG: acyl-ACP--UDP-N-acetylglucosamine O-acyltransferase [Phycisphaerales bacterium]|jgi:UDP-N-acetylglucosamine acyltransferase
MARIHPSAVVLGDVTIHPDAEIGPFCVIEGCPGPVRIGAGTRLLHRVTVQGPCTIGERNTMYPGVTLGLPPQDLGFNPSEPGPGLVIGSDNVFREGVTIHRGKTQVATQVGNHNYFMVNSHAGHDCVIGDRNIFANGTLLAGHVEVADRVIMGGNATVHQFCRVGRGAFVGGLTGFSLDLPPFFMTTGINIAGSINVVGMRRSGMSRADIDTVKWVYKVLQRSQLPKLAKIEELRTRAGDPVVDEYIAFVASAKRGIVPAEGTVMRGSAAGGE